MNSKLQRAYIALHDAETGRYGDETSPVLLVITLIYLIAVLSVKIYAPQRLVWLTAYPIIFSESSGIGYGKIFSKSLWILPLLLLIGIFNPILDRSEAFRIGSLTVSQGWVSFISILLRGLLSMQAVLILIQFMGFLGFFNTLRQLRCPAILCSQLLLTYRYLLVVLEETISMRQSIESRGYGRKSYPLRMWGRFIGLLLIRSHKRAVNIHRAMMARGFTGSLPLGKSGRLGMSGLLKLTGWTLFILVLRFTDFSYLISSCIR